MTRALAAFTLVGVFALTACTTQNTAEAETRQGISDEIARQIPRVTVWHVISPEVEGESPYEPYITLRSASTQSSELRDQARRAAHVVWNKVKHWTRLQIAVFCPEAEPPSGADYPEQAPCSSATLELTPASAYRMWGPSEIAHEPAVPTAGFMPEPESSIGFDRERPRPYPKDWSIRGPKLGGAADSTLVWNILLPKGTSDATRNAGLDTIRCLLWREQPDRLPGIILNVGEWLSSPTEPPSDSRTWQTEDTPAQLHQKCGDRAPGLPT
ncbi:hypothetical protein [Amycolatopsis sp. CA-230715]|uniref:hypothetical protein n=1 Tax=Amycolatopsis sp. CA-230715 TaxID=2745196 RepID=UPI001C028730|nr:hypothetical protein [Amycolatopsis sp. CA-230715]